MVSESVSETMKLMSTLLIISCVISNVRLLTSAARELMESAAVVNESFNHENMNSNNISGNYLYFHNNLLLVCV